MRSLCHSLCGAGRVLIAACALWDLCGCGYVVKPTESPTRTLVSADVVIYAATPSGIAAAIEAARLHKRVYLLEPSQHIGGMTASGLGATDLYDMNAIGGLAKAFFRKVAALYGSTVGNREGTRYEPHIAEQAFHEMLSKQAGIEIAYGVSLSSLAMDGKVITSLTASNGATYSAKEFIDASYEGDLMAAAHVSYVIGRESVSQYNESLAGAGPPVSLEGLAVDPYVVSGSPSSGLLQHIQSTSLASPGSEDSSVMAYTYRLCVSSDVENQLPFEPPANYDPKEFEVLGRFAQARTAKGRPLTISDLIYTQALPNHKLDLNNTGYISTDEVGESAAYPDASPQERRRIAEEHKRYVQAFLYFISTDPRIPIKSRVAVQSLGLCKDEFEDSGGWPWQLYVREARRMVGSYVLTQRDAQNMTKILDPIGLGGYNFDCHFTNRIAIDGNTKMEVRGGTRGSGPYPIPYRILTPRSYQVTNLLVSVAVSASHIAFDSLRIEPTFMIMGQAAGAAASLAIDAKAAVQDVNYGVLANQLRDDGQLLTAP